MRRRFCSFFHISLRGGGGLPHFPLPAPMALLLQQSQSEEQSLIHDTQTHCTDLRKYRGFRYLSFHKFGEFQGLWIIFKFLAIFASYSLFIFKSHKSIFKNFINEKFKKDFFFLLFFTCILPGYVPHESSKEFFKNSNF